MTADEAPCERVVRLGEVGSTNDEAMARLRAGEGPLWVVARRQTAGRGRRARSWVSAAGNLYASHGRVTELDGDALGMVPLAASVALGEAIAGATGLAPALKWPNDVLIDGRKVSGILLKAEMAPAPARVRRLVIGFGVNVAHHPAALAAAHLQEFCPTVTDDDVLRHLRPALSRVMARLAMPGGVGHLRARWLGQATGLGTGVVVRFDAAERHGRFVDLDPAGRLVLEAHDGTRETIAAGDVFAPGHGR